MAKLRKMSKTYYLRQIVACLLVYCILLAVPAQVALADIGTGGNTVVDGIANVNAPGGGANAYIDVLSDRAVINWQDFDTSTGQLAEFVRAAGGNFAVLNRVIAGGATQFDGSLFGIQGHIIIVNPQGIVFGPTALVQAHKFTASALDVANTDFMNGIYNFTGDGVGQVANYGTISADQVALIGRQVLNAGVIRSPGGYVLMAVGDKVLLGQDGSNVVVEVEGVTVPDPMDVTAAGIGDVINEGTIEAAGGKIVLAAGDTFSRAIDGLDSLTAAVDGGTGRVGQFGTLSADGVEGDGGSITMTAGDVVALSSDSVTTANAGTNGDGGEIKVLADMESGFAVLAPGASLQAKGGEESGDGGFIELSANKFQTLADIDVSAENGEYGTFLLDPWDIYIRDSANNTQDYNFLLGANPFPDYLGNGLNFSTADDNTDGDSTFNEIASGYLATLAGNIILQAQNDLIVDQITNFPLIWGSPTNLIFQTGRHIQFSSAAGGFSVSTGGSIHLEADSPHWPGTYDGIGHIDLGRVNLSAGSNVTMIGRDFIMDNATVSAAGGTVIGPAGNNMPMTLGYAGSMLIDAELDNITTPSLIIGQATTAGIDGIGTGAQIFTAGNITADDVTAPAGWNTLTLYGTGLGDWTSDSGIQVGTLNLNIGGSIGTNADHFDTSVSTLAVNTGTAAGDVYIDDSGGSLTLAGVNVGNGLLDITASSPITVSSPISVSGNVTLTASEGGGVGTDDIDVDADIISSGGNVTLRAGDDIDLSTGGVTIESQPVGGTVTLTAAYGDLESGGSITGTGATIDADNITLEVAGTAAGTIGTGTGNPIQIDLGTGTLTLKTGDAGGHIYVEETFGDIGTANIVINTDGVSAQTVYIENSSGAIDVDGTLNINDNLSLYTTAGTENIIFTNGASIITTGNATLNATGAIRDGQNDSGAPVVDIQGATINLTAASGGIGTPALGPVDGVLEVTATTALNADTDAGDDGNILIDSIGD
ncbi:MAG: filamentous hemagglutinin N-terminal domain-containing protein, partial [Planctomycetes bacterium]|nr:filamentous hemagglutinin N-terminal domain-containing protein [Planctomycetota bacterium]